MKHRIQMSSLLFLILFSLFIPSSTASSTSSKLYFDHLSIRDGLSHNSVYALLQDKHGYIWIGTQNGLNKYDSYSFELQKATEDSIGFKGKTITSLLEDSSGRLWVGTAKNGLNLRDNSSENFVNLNSKSAFTAIRDKEITQISEDSAGKIYITTQGAGLLVYDPTSEDTQHFTVKNGLANDNVFDVQEDKSGRIWIACAGPGLNYLTEDGIIQHLNYATENSPNLNGYRKRLTIEENYIWLATEGTGFYKISLDDYTFTHFATFSEDYKINTNSVRDIIRLDEGPMLIATDGAGLYIFNEQNDELINYSHKVGARAGLNSNALLKLLKDKEGNIWIGSYNGGINIHKVNKTWFEHYSPESAIGAKMSNPSVLSIAEIGNEIYLGTDGGGINILNEEGELRDESLDLPSQVVKSILQDSQGNTWLGLFAKGIYRINADGSTRSYFSDPNEPHTACGSIIWSMTESENGDIWIASLDQGLCIYSPKTDNFYSAEAYGLDNSALISDNNVMVVFADSKDRIWIGTASDGLVMYDKTRRFSHFTYSLEEPSSLSNNDVRSIYEDKTGTIWIGTESGGLNKWNGDKSFSKINTQNGLIANSAMAMTEDSEGFLWLSTFKGISRISPSSLEIKNFDFRNNEKNNQFNQLAIHRSKNGNLYFGGINGLNVINPAQVKQSSKSSKIAFTELKVLGEKISFTKKNNHSKLKKPIEEAETIYLNHNDNSFTIQFSAFDFNNPQEVIYEYMMEGFDDSWRKAESGIHFASYTNLDPDKYTFMVRSDNEISSIRVHIKPPFYKTLLFRILALLFLLGLIYFGLQFWNNRKEAEYKQQMLKVESENLQLRNEKLAADLNAKNSKLMFSSVQMAHKNDILRDLKDELKVKVKESPNKELKMLLRNIDAEIKGEDYWQEFNIYFEQTDHEFINSLIKKHPKLTQNDLRLCSLLRLRLSTKEIASLLNISVRGVEQSRYRLKKRLEIQNGQDLVKYIASLDSHS